MDSKKKRETPDAATPGVVRVEDLASLLNQIDRHVSGLTIRLNRKLKDRKRRDDLAQRLVHVGKQGGNRLFYWIRPLHLLLKLCKPRKE